MRGPLKNQEEIISIVVRRIEPWLFSYKTEAAARRVLSRQFFGNAVAFKIFLARLAGLGWRINYAQQSAGF